MSEILLSTGKDNYFFGFHDLFAWNANGDKLLALKIESIDTPPNASLPCQIGYLNNEKKFTILGYTYSYNYPQGARQQWVGTTDYCIVNDKVNNKWGSKLYDTVSGKCLKELMHSCHVITDDGWAFGLDYARLFRVGGYGYAGLPDVYADQNAPDKSGIIKHNIYTGESNLLISINTVANFEMKENKGKHHYITHLLLNPTQQRLAFLHRYKLSDGGETTRLMSIDINGGNLRCLSQGFLSHFDWKDDQHLVIWGRVGTGIEKLRQSFLYRLVPSSLTMIAKKTIKGLLYKPKKTEKYAEKYTSAFSWHIIEDNTNAAISFFAKDIITEDGHPMFCPVNRNWMICDNYPDINGIRTLFLFNYKTKKKIELGRYKKLDKLPDITASKELLNGIDNAVLKSFTIEKMAFTRSGLHCDLHPRWKRDGKMVAFDSIHEGSRQVYGINVGSYIQ